MCRLGFLAFTEKFDRTVRPFFVAEVVANMDAIGGTSVGLSFFKEGPGSDEFSAPNPGSEGQSPQENATKRWVLVDEAKFMGSGRQNFDNVKAAVGAVKDFDAVLVHNRLATHGALDVVNCHPIRKEVKDGRPVLLVHNGVFESWAQFLEEFGERTPDSLVKEGKKKLKKPGRKMRLGPRDFIDLSDSHYIAALLSRYGAEALKDVLIGAGTLGWWDSGDGSVSAVRTNGNELVFFALKAKGDVSTGWFQRKDADGSEKSDEVSCYGFVSDAAHLPMKLEEKTKRRNWFMGSVLHYDTETVRTLAEFNRLHVVAEKGVLYRVLPGKVERVGVMFDEKAEAESRRKRDNKKAWSAQVVAEFERSAANARFKMPEGQHRTVQLFDMKDVTLENLNQMALDLEGERWWFEAKPVRNVRFDSLMGIWIAGDNDEFMNWSGTAGDWTVKDQSVTDYLMRTRMTGRMETDV